MWYIIICGVYKIWTPFFYFFKDRLYVLFICLFDFWINAFVTFGYNCPWNHIWLLPIKTTILGRTPTPTPIPIQISQLVLINSQFRADQVSSFRLSFLVLHSYLNYLATPQTPCGSSNFWSKLQAIRTSNHHRALHLPPCTP